MMQDQATRFNWKWMLGSALLAEAIGFASNLLCGDVRGYYASLKLPPLAPPGWLFGVVWVVLYAVMGCLAGWLMSLQTQKHQKERRLAVSLYWIQLILNFCWSPVFFRFHNFPLAVGIVLLLVILNVCLTLFLCKISKKAALWSLPYVAWLIFATYLTVGVFVLN